MRKRPRPSCSFQPKSDELEKLTGASTLTIGGLLATALDVVGQPATQSPIPRPVAPGDDTGSAAPRQPATTTRNVTTPKLRVASSPVAGVLLTSQTDQAPSRTELPARPAALPIRPLSLAPGGQVTLPTAPPQPRATNAGSNGGGSANSPVMLAGPSFGGGAAAAPTTDTANVMVPAQDGFASPNGAAPIGVGASPLSSSAPATPSAPAVAARIAAANSIAGSIKHLASGQPSHVMNGYVATVGSARSTDSSIYALSSSGASSGGGTGTGTTSTAPGASVATTSASKTNGSSGQTGQETGGTYTIPGAGCGTGGASMTPAAGNGTASTYAIPDAGCAMPYQGRIQIAYGGTNVIGGRASADVSGGGGTLSDTTWSISGTPVTYLSVTPPDPSKGQTQFVRTPFTPAKDVATGTFYWGETPGVATITVNTTVTVDGKPAHAEASMKIHVGDPGWKGFIRWSLVAKQVDGGDTLQYRASKDPGMNWANFRPIQPGRFDVVQIINSGSASIVDGNSTRTGFVSAPPAYKPAPFPLLDVNSPGTSAFYSGADGLFADSPSMPTTRTATSTMNLSFQDSVMYMPPNGVWVPEGTFTWKVLFKSVPGTWTPTKTNTATPKFTPPKVDHSAWPSGWVDLAFLYRYNTP